MLPVWKGSTWIELPAAVVDAGEEVVLLCAGAEMMIEPSDPSAAGFGDLGEGSEDGLTVE